MYKIFYLPRLLVELLYGPYLIHLELTVPAADLVMEAP